MQDRRPETAPRLRWVKKQEEERGGKRKEEVKTPGKGPGKRSDKSR